MIYLIKVYFSNCKNYKKKALYEYNSSLIETLTFNDLEQARKKKRKTWTPQFISVPLKGHQSDCACYDGGAGICLPQN